MSGVIVTLAHVRAALPRRCSRGLRQWCAANGIDWSEFVRKGVPIEVLEAKGDALIEPVLVLARAEASDGH